MATGRTHHKWDRVFVSGYDVSGMSRTVGPLELTYDEHDLTADMGDQVKGYQKGQTHANVGTLNAVFDNTAVTGIHALLGTAGGIRLVMVCKGIQGVPADGDPAFCGQFIQGAYQVVSGGAVTVSVPFQGHGSTATYLNYCMPWGILLHANAARTAVQGVNAAVGFDNPTGAATSKGALFVWMVTAGDGTATLLAQDAAVNNDGGFVNITSATTGLIDMSTPTGGIIYCAGVAGAIRQYVRWQISFAGGTASTVTFLSALCRFY